MGGDFYNVMEFYKTGKTEPFLRRPKLMGVPKVGDGINISMVSGEVVRVVWNMDYQGGGGEQWRCNVYIKPYDDMEEL